MNFINSKNDTKSKSLSEAFANSFGSYPIGYGVSLLVLPAFSYWIQKDPFTINLVITLIFASISFTRIYFLRRLFEKFGFDDNIVRMGALFCKKLSHHLWRK